MLDIHEKCQRCGISLTPENWDRSWHIRICNECKDKWVIESMKNEDEAPQKKIVDRPHSQPHPERQRIMKRDSKLFKLTGICSICNKEVNFTLRHHQWYPVKKYNPNAILEVCRRHHTEIHARYGSMPIIDV